MLEDGLRNLKEGGMSVRIVLGPNAISLHGANHKNFMGFSKGKYKATVGDVSFSSFLEAMSNPDHQELGSPLEGQRQTKGGREISNV